MQEATWVTEGKGVPVVLCVVWSIQQADQQQGSCGPTSAFLQALFIYLFIVTSAQLRSR